MSAAQHDLFLEWLSWRGEGSWDAFREAHAYLFGEAAPTGLTPKPSWLAALLIALGHLEVDWEGGRWSVTTPCLAGLPSAGSTAVLTGARTSLLLSRLKRLAQIDEFDDLDLLFYTPDDGPTVIYVQYGSVEVIEAFAQELDLVFERWPAERLSHLLPNIQGVIDRCLLTPEPPTGFAVDVFDPARLVWTAAGGAGPGLFRYRAYWSDRYRLYANGVYREVDRDIGVWATIASNPPSRLRYEQSPVNGTLVVPAVARLPGSFARAAVLCSGLPPKFDHETRTIRYENVPKGIVGRIGRALGQEPVLTAARDPNA